MGAPPTRIDILRRLEGVSLEQAFERKITTEWAGVAVDIIGFDDLLASKRAAGREQDMLDVRALERAARVP